MKIVSVVLMMVGSPLANAIDWHSDTTSGNVLDTAMWLSNADYSLRSDITEVSISVDRIGVSLFEITPDNIKYGATIGNAYLSDTDQVDTKGINLSGNYLAVGVQYRLWEQSLFSVNLGVAYLYQQVTGETSSQSAKQRWAELTGQIDSRIKISNLLSVELGWRTGKLTMHQQAAGLVDNNIDFENAVAYTSSVGLDFSTGNRGWVGIFFSQGYEQGIQLKFQRLYL